MKHQNCYPCNKKVFSDEMDYFCKENCIFLSRSEMIFALKNKFWVEITLSQLKNAYVRLGLHSSRRSIGKRANIGDSNTTARGFKRVKTEIGWRLAHVENWEKRHGVLEKNNYIIFSDGDKSNVAIDNLICINRREYYFFNQLKKETDGLINNKLLVAIARIKAKAIERENDN